MKHLAISIVALLSCLALMPATAQENPVYFGVKGGQMDADASSFDAASNIGVILGYALFRNATGSLALEGEYTHNLSKGDVAGGGNWEIETLAAYGAYRTADKAYLKAKAGALRVDIECRGTNRAVCGKDSGLSFGAGVGWRLNRKVGVELEYTVIDQDVGFLSLGYFTHF